jgi:hypothetical protein
VASSEGRSQITLVPNKQCFVGSTAVFTLHTTGINRRETRRENDEQTARHSTFSHHRVLLDPCNPLLYTLEGNPQCEIDFKLSKDLPRHESGSSVSYPNTGRVRPDAIAAACLQRGRKKWTVCILVCSCRTPALSSVMADSMASDMDSLSHSSL